MLGSVGLRRAFGHDGDGYGQEFVDFVAGKGDRGAVGAAKGDDLRVLVGNEPADDTAVQRAGEVVFKAFAGFSALGCTIFSSMPRRSSRL